MAISSKEIETLIYLKKNSFLNHASSVIEIGAQQLSNDFLKATDKINEIAAEFQLQKIIDLPASIKSHIVHGSLEHLDPNAMHARVFWEWLGFSYKAIDIDDSPDSIALDLNFDVTPNNMKNRYDLVTNFGTTEHLVNQLNAFQVIHELTKMGGLMMHTLPSQGMMNHGLFNYNPKFFWMLARSNGYKWVYSDYVPSTDYYDLPENIVNSILPHNPGILQKKEGYHISDCYFTVVMQKTFDTPYVPALDVPTGTVTRNKTLAKRYWSVFEENPFSQKRKNWSQVLSYGIKKILNLNL